MIAIRAYVFPSLQNAKDVVRQMSKTCHFRRPFNKQSGKLSQIPLKPAWHHLYYIYWSLWQKMSGRNNLLVICKIWGLFVNSLTADDKFSLFNRHNITQTIQMQLSKKEISFFGFFTESLKSKSTFEHFEKKRWPSFLMYFRNYRLQRRWLEKYLKSLAWGDPSTINLVNGPKHCWYLHDSTLTILIDHCEGN